MTEKTHIAKRKRFVKITSDARTVIMKDPQKESPFPHSARFVGVRQSAGNGRFLRPMKKTYSEKLKDPRWQRKRLEIMGRDGFECSICGCSEGMLSVHHAYYVSGRHPWQYPNWSLRTLCGDCHDFEHEMNTDVAEADFAEWEIALGWIAGREPLAKVRMWDLFAEIAQCLNAIDRDRSKSAPILEGKIGTLREALEADSEK